MNQIYEYTEYLRKNDETDSTAVLISLRKHVNRNIKQLVERIERNKTVRKVHECEYDNLKVLVAIINKCTSEYVHEDFTQDPSELASVLDNLAILSKNALKVFAESEDTAIRALAKNELDQNLFAQID
jgi:hypothetical protein